MVAAGEAVLGADRNVVAFGWDNEFDRHSVRVAEFEIDALPVTNQQFLEFLNDGGYRQRELWTDEAWEWLRSERISHPSFWQRSSDIDHRSSDIDHRSSIDDHRPSSIEPAWHWRGMFEAIPLPPDWPVYVSQAEASAYARWKDRRLMTEAEFHRAAYGSSGDVAAPPDGHYDFAGFDPIPAGSCAPSPSGAYDLVGNGWEWTSSIFAPFKGFAPMASYPEYSADFFDGLHYVMKGASPVTARELVRPGFRNWFRATYPYVYAKFRTVR